MNRYYEEGDLFTKKDLNGEEPSLFIVTSNRSDGKTTHFIEKSLQLWKQQKKKTVLIYRHRYELKASKDLYTGILQLTDYKDSKVDIIPKADGFFYSLTLDGEEFAFSCSLSKVDVLKKFSAIFADVDLIIFDEFQLESGEYLKNEVEKFLSVLQSITRGGGSQSRTVRTILLGNMVSIMNPYFIKLGIYKRVSANTKYLRGNGWIAQFRFNENASKAIKDNALYKGFENESYIKYSAENVYLHDSDCFCSKIKGRYKYVCTIVHDGEYYGIRDYLDKGIVHISKSYEPNFPMTFVFNVNDHSPNTIMISKYSWLTKRLKQNFYNGVLRFDDMKTKNAIFDILAIDIYK